MKTDPWVLITGASSGIGLELAKLFARDKYHLVLVARNQAALEKIALDFQNQYGTSVKVLPQDLSLPSAPEEIYQTLKKEGLFVEILVNNAGYGSWGMFPEIPLKEQTEMLQVNVNALIQLSHFFLQDMIQERKGKILNVASTAAFQPGPLMAVYYATKAFVLSFSEALSNEMKGKGVSVTVLCPGPTRTDFFKRARFSDNLLKKDGIAQTAEEVARVGYEGLMKGKRLVVSGFLNRLFTVLVRFAPRGLILSVVRYVQDKH